MAMTKTEVIDWLQSLDDDDLVAIDDGGLALVLVGNEDCYCEVGGVPLD
jgi:hypothetical protein